MVARCCHTLLIDASVWFACFKQRTSIGPGFLWGATKQFETYRQSNFKKGTWVFTSGDSGGVWSLKFWLTFPSLLKLEGHGPSSDTPVDLSLQPRNSCKSEKILKIWLYCMMALWFRRLSLCSTERSGDKPVNPLDAAYSLDSQHSHWGQNLKKQNPEILGCKLLVCHGCRPFLSVRNQKTTVPPKYLRPWTPASRTRRRMGGMTNVA